MTASEEQELVRENMTFADVRWFLNKDNQLWGTQIASEIGELAVLNVNDEDLTWQNIYNEADIQMRDWNQNAR